MTTCINKPQAILDLEHFISQESVKHPGYKDSIKQLIESMFGHKLLLLQKKYDCLEEIETNITVLVDELWMTIKVAEFSEKISKIAKDLFGSNNANAIETAISTARDNVARQEELGR